MFCSLPSLLSTPCATQTATAVGAHSQEAEEETVHKQQENEPEGEGVEQVTPRRPQNAIRQVLLNHDEDHGNDVQHHTLSERYACRQRTLGCCNSSLQVLQA